MIQQKKFSSDEIKELVKSYRGRGEMSRPQFCEGRGITLSALDYYLRKHKQISQPVMRLAKVIVKPVPAGKRGGFALVLANGRRVECGEAELAPLIRIAEAV